MLVNSFAPTGRRNHGPQASGGASRVRPLRVLLASKHPHYPQGGGGLERNTHELCLRLARRGVVPAVLCNLRSDRSPVALMNRFSRMLNPKVRFPADRGLGYRVYRGWADEDGAHEVVSRFKPDVVIAQSSEPIPLLQAFEGAGVPRMAYFHEVERLGDVEALARMLDVGLLANSAFTARKMAETAQVQPAVIVPLIDRSFYLTTVRPQTVLFVNTRPRKGLEIAFRLAESRPDVPFDFVKSWILTPEETQDMAARAHAAGNITLHAPTNDMRPLYSRARLLLAPSQWEETWGRVATEAQINGIPVLASDRGGLPESVGPGGLLVDHDAPMDVWSEAFSTIWDDPVRHAQYAAEALNYSQRPEIQPEAVVTKFIGVVSAFVAQHAARG